MGAGPSTRKGSFLPQETSRSGTEVVGNRNVSSGSEEEVWGSQQDLGAERVENGSIELRSEKDVEVRIWGDFFTGGWNLGKPCSSWFNSVAFSSAFSLSFCQRPVEKELLYPFDR